MIFSRDSIFPYPAMTNDGTSYKNNLFEFEIEDLFDTETEYTFKIKYELGSSFLKEKLKEGYAELVFVINSQDSYFKKLDYDEETVTIPKSRLTLLSRTKIQLQIRALNTLYFANNNDLHNFYNDYKTDIVVQRNSILGYSNIEEFKGSQTNPFTLFETAVNSNQEELFKADIRENIIVLSFKDSKYLLNQYSSELKNMFIYTGLSRALVEFLNYNAHGDEAIDLYELNDTNSALDSKLYELMLNKGITELSYSNIDYVISKISYKIIESFVDSIERLSSHED
ncbi:hypothetical protein [Nosocomiicoccus ampullae]|uniref:hypothetical protein n=1 Tax=Nosocomiicoccus ampullae TaxID=489910 RepID=UPI001C5F8F8B|nr:hypothetical protein [Nosocomiicoccus ampullae]QYA49019.1 hypothetical protein KPF52_03055 [Nosocomiicoccus ampullae]